ncbi:hypothetical protein NFJ02_39g98550 [Pycnococcus provasolii]
MNSFGRMFGTAQASTSAPSTSTSNATRGREPPPPPAAAPRGRSATAPNAAISEEVQKLQRALWAAQARTDAANRYAEEQYTEEELTEARLANDGVEEGALEEEISLLKRLQNAEAFARRKFWTSTILRPALIFALLVGAVFVVYKGQQNRQNRHFEALEATMPRPWWYDTHDNVGTESIDEALTPLSGERARPYIGAKEATHDTHVPAHVKVALANGTYDKEGVQDGVVTHVSETGETFTKDPLPDGDRYRGIHDQIGYGDHEAVRPWHRSSLMGRSEFDVLHPLDDQLSIKYHHCEQHQIDVGVKGAHHANRKWGKEMMPFICKRLAQQRKVHVIAKFTPSPPPLPNSPPMTPTNERNGIWAVAKPLRG